VHICNNIATVCQQPPINSSNIIAVCHRLLASHTHHEAVVVLAISMLGGTRRSVFRLRYSATNALNSDTRRVHRFRYRRRDRQIKRDRQSVTRDERSADEVCVKSTEVKKSTERDFPSREHTRACRIRSLAVTESVLVFRAVW